MKTPLMLSGPSSVPQGATHALICLHGFGANGQDFISLAQPLQNALGKLGETMALFSPNAPFPSPMAEEDPESRQWFDNKGWSFRDEEGLKTATAVLEGYLTDITRKHGIKRQNMVILGFSQGAMTTLHALPSLSQTPAGVIALSGGLTVNPVIGETTPTTPILFIHGLSDDVWPADYTVNAETFYRNHGYPTHLELIENLYHGLDARVLAHITLFLADVWKAD